MKKDQHPVKQKLRNQDQTGEVDPMKIITETLEKLKGKIVHQLFFAGGLDMGAIIKEDEE